MKKVLILIGFIFLGLSANAVDLQGFGISFDDVEVINLTSGNIWNTLGKREQKIYNVGSKILNANKINKRVVFFMNNMKTINASASYTTKSVNINKGTLNYIDNDDELAAIISHEIAHNIDYYGGLGKVIIMKFNCKAYEYQADLKSIDYMVKAGYNPVAAITVMNKISGENTYDWGVLWSHPKTSKRLLNMYKYIYVKYPQYLSSDFTKNISYQNWVNTANKDIQSFQQREKVKALKRGNL